jgi:N6-adenosine-specific RNA methylase IME4
MLTRLGATIFLSQKVVGIEEHYSTMSIEEICALQVPSADNAVLYLWATASKLLEALAVMKSWGFEYKTHAIWDKEKIGIGFWFRGQHELLLVGVKGNFSPPKECQRISSVIRIKRDAHSKKPDAVRAHIQSCFPTARKLELFARGQYSGWSLCGNQASNSISIPGMSLAPPEDNKQPSFF